MKMINRISMNIKNIFLEECWRLTHLDSVFKKGNSKFYLPDRRDFIQQQIIITNNFFEKDILKELEKYIKKDFVYLDIGANIGHHTIYFYKELGAKKVYSFEPIKYLHSIINKSLELNNINNAKIYHMALGNESKITKIFVPKFKPFLRKNFGISVIDEERGQQEVKLEKLDNINFNEKIDVIKIDTEGFEKEVLKGAINLIKKDRPLVWVEVKSENENFIFDFFKKENYKRIKIEGEDNFFIPNRARQGKKA